MTKTRPPHLLLAAAPPLVVIAVLLLTPSGRHFIHGMSLKWSVLIHSIRIFVEVNLYLLFLHKQVPVQMTFESGNLDILAGLTAPLIWWAFNGRYIGNSQESNESPTLRELRIARIKRMNARATVTRQVAH